MSQSRFSFDTDPHPVLSTYSAGNFGEVAPERLSIAAWSLIGDPVERGCRKTVKRFWPRATWHTGSYYAFIGYFACRPYHNLSAFCHMTEDVPLVEASDVTSSYFEGRLPPRKVLQRGTGLLERAGTLPRMLQTFGRVRPRLVHIEGRMAELELGLIDAIERQGSFHLGRVFSEARTVLDEAWELHYTTTTTAVPLQAWQRRLADRVVPYWNELEAWLNRPEELVWNSLHGAASAALPSADFLAHPFYEIAADHEPWSAYAPSARVYEATDDVVRASAPLLASTAWEILPRTRLALLPPITRLVVDSLECREMSKSIAMRAMHLFRRLLPGIAAAVGVSEGDWPYLTCDELAQVRSADDARRLAAARRDECRQALREAMPDELSFGFAGTATGRSRHNGDAAASAVRERLRGRGVSPGVVRGTVITPAQANDRDGRPRILVCESADADVQPLLPKVDGVVTARGSALSHVAILVREYGIPAVVGYGGATSLRPGQELEIDGTTGEVTIVGG